MKKAIIAVVLVAAAGVLAVRFLRSRDFLYAGTIEATEVDLSSRLTSVISAFPAKEGRTVRQGEVLVNLACEDQKLAADIAAKDFKRAVELRRTGSLPQESYDRTLNKREDADLRLGWCSVASPIDATVLATYHEPGELVNPGTRLLTLADLREVWALVYVPETLLYKLKPGMEVEAELPEVKRTLRGSIDHINSEAEFTPKNVQTRQERTRLVFGVKVTFPNPDTLLKPGMTVEVRLPKG